MAQSSVASRLQPPQTKPLLRKDVPLLLEPAPSFRTALRVVRISQFQLLIALRDLLEVNPALHEHTDCGSNFFGCDSGPEQTQDNQVVNTESRRLDLTELIALTAAKLCELPALFHATQK